MSKGFGCALAFIAMVAALVIANNTGLLRAALGG